MSRALDALARLRGDYPLYASQFLRIRDKSGKVVPFVLNQAQRFIHSELERMRAETGRVRALILKGRQQGVSTYVEGRFFWRCAMNKGKTAFILTHEDRATANIFRMAKHFLEHLPVAMRPELGASNANELVFSRLGSRYAVGTSRTTGTGRSFTAQYFHGSEAAFWANSHDHLAGLGQTIPDLPGTEVIIESTANGIGNLFHSMCMSALRGVGDYRLIFVPWYWQSEYSRVAPEGSLSGDDAEYQRLHGITDQQAAWRRAKIDTDFQGDEALFDQEYPATVSLAFRASSTSSFIALPLIERAMSTQVEAAGVKIMGVDPAEYGDDATAIARRQGRKVLPIERFYHRGPMEIAGIVARRADDWQPDAINVDCTGVGSGVADRLIELGYPVNRVHFGGKAIEDTVYLRRKDEMYGEFKKWLEDIPCELPDDEVLKTDIVAPFYSYDSSRRLVLESKEKMRKRGLNSPDSADAVALTFAERISAVAGKGHRPPPNWRAC